MDLTEVERIARVGTWDYNPRSGELIWSEVQYRIMGVGEDFVPTYDGYLRIVHPDDRARTERAMRRSLATGEDYTVMHRITIEDSSPGMALCRGRVELDADGTPLRMVGVSVDLTDLQRSAEVHRAKHDLLEITEQLTGVGSFVWEIDDGVITLSDNMRRVLGLGIGEGIGDFDDYIALVHPDDRPERRRIVQEVLAGGEVTTSDYRIVRPSGEIRHLQSKVQLVHDENGKPLRLIGAVRDLTDWPNSA